MNYVYARGFSVLKNASTQILIRSRIRVAGEEKVQVWRNWNKILKKKGKKKKIKTKCKLYENFAGKPSTRG